jgi:hypothetical protein
MRRTIATTLILLAGVLGGGCPGSIDDPVPFRSGIRVCRLEGDVLETVPQLFRERCGDAIACHGNPDTTRAGGSLFLLDDMLVPDGGTMPGPSLESQLIGVEVAHMDAACDGRYRIVPGVPNESFLLEKIEAIEPSCGSRMPLGQDPLSRTEVNCIAAWIYEISQGIDAGIVRDAGGAGEDAGTLEDSGTDGVDSGGT